MRLINLTKYPEIPNYALRRVISWSSRQIGLRLRDVADVKVGNRFDGFTSGRCWVRSGRIHISLGVAIATEFPPGLKFATARHAGMPVRVLVGEEGVRARLEKMVHISLHELTHRLFALEGVKTRRSGKPGGSERHVNTYIRPFEREFAANRTTLLDLWLAPPAGRRGAADPVAAARAARRDRDEELLATWERKLKLAKTKVAKYRRRVSRARRLSEKE